MNKALALCFGLIAVSGCVTEKVVYRNSPSVTPFSGTQQPIEKAVNLREGMSESEVISVLGTPITRDFQGNGSALQWCKTGEVTSLFPLDRYVIGFFYDRWSAKRKDPERARRMGTLLATGLIVGESLFGVVYAGIVGTAGNDEPLAIVGDSFATPATIIGAVFFFGSIFALYRWTSGMVSRTDSAPVTDEAEAEETLDVH